MTGRGLLLLATRNRGKVAELAPLAASWGWRVETLDEAGLVETAAEAVLEDADTFAANARAKARYFAARSGRLVLAEDSGLEVVALQGAPGVRSKRWAVALGCAGSLDGASLDDANNRALLDRLAGVGAVSPEDRRARFVCAAVAAWPGGLVEAEGATAGWILPAPRGSEGFGYDPVFWSAELGMGFGEVVRERKSTVSHRTRAVTALLGKLAAVGQGGAGAGARGTS